MRELVCNRPVWARAVLKQLRSYKVVRREHFPATVWWKPWRWQLLFNIFWQRHNLSALRITIKSVEWRYLGFLVYYSARTSRHRQNGLSYVPKKILTWMLRKARGVLNATVSNRVTTWLSLYANSILFFSVSFSQSLVFPVRLCSKACHHILDIAGLCQAEIWRTYLIQFNSHCCSFIKTNLRKIDL